MSTSVPTKRELREQRRAERQAAEAAEAARSRKRRRLAILGGVAALAAVLVVVGIAVSSSGGKAPSTPAPAKSTLFTGIPESNGVLGNAKAKVTVTEFLDLQCPICAAASKSTLPNLINDYVRSDKVKLQARPLHFIGGDSVRAARVAAGAEQQGHLWPFLESFYASQGQENSGYVTDGFLRSVASAAGIDGSKALGYAKTSAANAPMEQADAEAQQLRVSSTPTFVVTRDGGSPTVIGSGVLDQATMNKAIDKALGR
jgi:protein-disulfide isomerase